MGDKIEIQLKSLIDIVYDEIAEKQMKNEKNEILDFDSLESIQDLANAALLLLGDYRQRQFAEMEKQDKISSFELSE